MSAAEQPYHKLMQEILLTPGGQSTAERNETIYSDH